MTNADLAIDCGKKAGHNFALRDRALQNARSPDWKGYRTAFVQIARLHNQAAVRYMRMARTYLVMDKGGTPCAN